MLTASDASKLLSVKLFHQPETHGSPVDHILAGTSLSLYFDQQRVGSTEAGCDCSESLETHGGLEK